MSLIVFEKPSSDITLNTFQMHHAVWKTHRFPFPATTEKECRNRIVHSQLCHTTTDQGCAASTLKHPPDAKRFWMGHWAKRWIWEDVIKAKNASKPKGLKWVIQAKWWLDKMPNWSSGRPSNLFKNHATKCNTAGTTLCWLPWVRVLVV